MVGLENNLLTATVFFPLLWAIGGLVIPTGTQSGKAVLKTWTFLGTLITLLFSVLMYSRFTANGADFQMTESMEWLPALGITYSLGVDGISLWLILLTTFLMPIAVLCSFT